MTSPLEVVEARLAELAPTIKTLGAAEELTTEQRSEWDAATAEWDTLKAREADLKDRAERAKAAANMPSGPTLLMAAKNEEVDARSALQMRGDEVREAAKRAVGETVRFLQPEHAESVDKLIRRDRSQSYNPETVARMVLVCGSDIYRTAWAKAMSGQPINTEEARALEAGKEIQRAMTVGTGSAGGFFVPTPLDPSMIITGAGSYNPFRMVSTTKQLTEGNTWKGVTAGQISASWDTEASAVSDDAATLTQPSISTFTGRTFIPASFETFEDASGLAEDVAALFVDARDNLEASAFAVGTGTGQPKGVMVAVAAVAGSRVTTTTAATYAIGDLYKPHTALPPRHRLKGSSRAWMMNVARINDTRQFATANNYHAFLTDLGGGQPPQLLGDPLFEAPAIVSTLTTGSDILIYGDFAKYYIVDKIGMTTEFIPNLFDTSTGRPTGQRAWLMHWRVGADVVDADAFRVLRTS